MIGICFGGYCPLHQGHLDLILRAKKECSRVYVIVCGYTGEPRGQEIGLTSEDRYDLISDFFKNDDIIQVDLIKDDDLGIDQSMSPKNWLVWSTYILNEIVKKESEDIVWYVAEEKYQKDLENLGYTVSRFPKQNEVSGTEIRKNPLRYWPKITIPFRPFLVKKILITGTASEGKTNLSKDICRYFGLPWIPEFGRTWMESSGLRDPELGLLEFREFLKGQQDLINVAIHMSPGVIVSDTDSLITLMYAKAYSERPEMKITPEEYEILHSEVPMTKWDKIFLLPPVSENFVDDGIRYLPQASLKERQGNYKILLDLLDEFGMFDKIEILNYGYLGNYERVKNYIQNFYR